MFNFDIDAYLESINGYGYSDSPKNREIAKEKFFMLKSMNELVKCINDETAYYGSWILIVPDEASDEELADIASDEDDEIYADACKLFAKLVAKYYPTGGFYIGEKVY